MDKKYLTIVDHYETCLDRFGDSHRGVDWPKAEDVSTRYQVMLDVVRPSGSRVSLLDFGCGAAHFYEFLTDVGRRDIEYHGLDLSPKFIDLCRRKHPTIAFTCTDVLDPDSPPVECDYAVMNGVFTEKCGLSFEEMFAHFKAVVRKVFFSTRIGIAFNVMSKHVDWERPDLFHLPHDALAGFATRELTRQYVIRNDYGLYEYTTYLYK